MKSMARYVWMAVAIIALSAGLAVQAVEPPTANASGSVASVDLNAGTLGVQSRARVRTFLIGMGTAVLLNNHAGTLQDIQVGDQVNVRYNTLTYRAERVVIHRFFQARGVIVNATATSIALQTKQQRINSQVNAATRFLVAGTPVDDAPVLLGLRAKAKLETGTNLGLRFDAKAPTIAGTVTAVNPGTGAFTLGGATIANFELHPMGRVTFAGRAITLAGLLVGDKANVAYSNIGPPATALVVRVKPGALLRARGVITALGANTLTLATSAGPLTLAVNAATKIKRKGKRAAFGDLLIGDRVKAKYAARTGENTAVRIISRPA